jgi:hypothetical protein
VGQKPAKGSCHCYRVDIPWQGRRGPHAGNDIVPACEADAKHGLCVRVEVPLDMEIAAAPLCPVHIAIPTNVMLLTSRWLDEAYVAALHPCAYMPFSKGPRCVVVQTICCY